MQSVPLYCPFIQHTGSSPRWDVIMVLKSFRPSLPLKKAPPLISVFSPQGRRGNPPFGAQNRCAIRLADHQRSTPGFAGWDRLGVYYDENNVF